MGQIYCYVGNSLSILQYQKICNGSNVDANTGQVINASPQMLDVVNEPLTAQTMYSGTLGITGGIATGGYDLHETRNGVDVHTMNANFGSNLYYATDISNGNTSFTDGNWPNFAQDQAGLDAHWAEEKTLDFWKTVFNRNSLDGQGIGILGYIHFSPDGKSWSQAQWVEGTHIMEYGDGDGGVNYTPFTCLDITAHELGHGINEFTAHLGTTEEPGALNEGFGDIWGASIENWAAPNKKQTWQMGEDITPSHNGVRSLSNPKEFYCPDTYKGPYWYDETTCTSDNDFCQVHRNSMVLGHWYYLLSVGGCDSNGIGNHFYVHGIGITDAEKIAWRTESQYLTHHLII